MGQEGTKVHRQKLAFLQEETMHVDFSKKIQDNKITCSGLKNLIVWWRRIILPLGRINTRSLLYPVMHFYLRMVLKKGNARKNVL